MRKNGVLLHITSLPSKYGIGTMGEAAYDFVDFLKKADQSIWQVLPLCPTGYGDSPYASYSTFAGNPYLIDLDLLARDDLLLPEEYQNLNWGDEPDRVDFGLQYRQRYDVLDKAVKRFLKNPDEEYAQFCEDQAYWLEDYALFMALKDANDGKAWLEWDKEHRIYDPLKANSWKEQYKERMDYYKVLQYLFYKQWNALRKYANDNGIEILGDLPIYVSLDSVDAWSNPELFVLDEENRPTLVAGCPPDGFSADGQLWGNPIYDWDYHKKSGYDWWLKRIGHATETVDQLRIDHFRGFDSYYAIPAAAKTAKNGQWLKGPGTELFEVVEDKLGKKNIIAEDLGFLTDSVKAMLAECGFPGMKILEFGFDSRDGGGSDYLPYNYPKNSIAYAGTHDNDTIQGWFKAISEEDRKYACDFMDAYNPHEYNWEMMRTVIASPSDTAILQAQDLLNLDSSSRMNTPGKLGGNWTWRMLPGQLDDDIAGTLKWVTNLYGRAPIKPKKETSAELQERADAAKAEEDQADADAKAEKDLKGQFAN